MRISAILRDVRILPISSLRLHEMTMRASTDKLKRMIRASRAQRSPILVDRRTRVVLDGMHRVAAFSELGYRNIMCQLVDYSARGLVAGAGHPSFSAKEPEAELAKLAVVQPVPCGIGVRELSASRCAFLLCRMQGGKRKCALVSPSRRRMGLEGLVEAQRAVNLELAERHRIRYVAGHDCDEAMEAGRSVLFRRPFSKKEVISLATGGRLFPPKTTRHMFPVRILNINAPLGWLRLPPKKAEKKLHRLLRDALEHEEVRYYPEPVLVVDDARFRKIE